MIIIIMCKCLKNNFSKFADLYSGKMTARPLEEEEVMLMM